MSQTWLAPGAPVAVLIPYPGGAQLITDEVKTVGSRVIRLASGRRFQRLTLREISPAGDLDPAQLHPLDEPRVVAAFARQRATRLVRHLNIVVDAAVKGEATTSDVTRFLDAASKEIEATRSIIARFANRRTHP